MLLLPPVFNIIHERDTQFVGSVDRIFLIIIFSHVTLSCPGKPSLLHSFPGNSVSGWLINRWQSSHPWSPCLDLRKWNVINKFETWARNSWITGFTVILCRTEKLGHLRNRDRKPHLAWSRKYVHGYLDGQERYIHVFPRWLIILLWYAPEYTSVCPVPTMCPVRWWLLPSPDVNKCVLG